MSLTSEVPPKPSAKLNRVDQVRAYPLTRLCSLTLRSSILRASRY